MAPVSKQKAAALELLRRQRLAQEAQAKHGSALVALRAQLSPRQLAFVEDAAAQVIAICTRQAGKTTGVLIKLFECLSRPGTIAYVLMPTLRIARDTMWQRLKDEAKARFGATDDHFHETLLEYRPPDTGSVLRLVGVPDRKRADRLRGQTLDLIAIDEAASFDPVLLQYIVQDVAQAALGIRGGQLILTSTPGLFAEGWLYEAYTDTRLDFSRHFFSGADNPAWKDWQKHLAKVRNQNGFTEDTPKYQREWLGKWVSDYATSVYRLGPASLTDAPITRADYAVMAIDFGATDASAICVVGWKRGSKVLHVLHEEAHYETDLTTLAQRLQALQEEHKPLEIMADGAAKQSILEITNRHGIPLERTPKAAGYKQLAIAQVNADLDRGLIRIARGSPLAGQMHALQWGKKNNRLIENQSQPNDRCDAFLYAYLRAQHYLEAEPDPPPEFGSEAYWRAQEAEMRAQAEEEAERAMRRADEAAPWDAYPDPGDPWAVN